MTYVCVLSYCRRCTDGYVLKNHQMFFSFTFLINNKTSEGFILSRVFAQLRSNTVKTWR